MKHKVLLKWAESLKGIRAQMQPDLNAGIISELDSVIVRIEEAARSGDSDHQTVVLQDVLSTIARIVEFATNVADLISKLPS